MIQFDNIPNYLRSQPRWTVFATTGRDVEGHPGKKEKFIRHCDGGTVAKGDSIRKGTYADTRALCEKNPLLIPAFWIEEKDGLVFIDRDGPGAATLMFPSYTERSLSSGYHCLGWFKGNLPGNIDGDEVYTKNRWICITGNVVDGRKDINDLSGFFGDKRVKKDNEPFTIPDDVTPGQREPTIHKMVWSLYSKGLSFSAILAAALEENRGFNPPKTEKEVTEAVRRAYQGAVQKADKKPRVNPRDNREKEIPEYELQPRGWFERGGNIFLEVIDTSQERPEYRYATMKNGKIIFISELTVKEPIRDNGKILIPGLKYIPRSLPENKDGQPIHIVGIPEQRLLELITSSDIERIRDKIKKHIEKYCELPSNDMDLCVYYVVSTWFFSALSTIPYLRFRADTGKGKSRILKVVSDLCFYPVRAGGASTAAGTIRFAEYWHGTLVIDEADIKAESDDSGGYTNDMIKFLNLGFERGQYFIKSDKTDPKKQEIFDPFCPKVIAMRGVFQDPATEGRCLSISPSETERKDIPAILPAEYDSATAAIRAELAQYLLTHWGIVAPSDPYPALDDVDCEPRLKQLGGPIGKVLSKIFPDGLTMFKHYIEQRQLEIKSDRAASFIGSAVNAVYDRALEQDHVFASDIADDLSSTSTRISRTLKDAGISIEQRRISVTIPATEGKPARIRNTVRKILVVKNSRAWREILRRYIIVKSEQNELTNNTLVPCPVSIQSNEYMEN